MSLAEVNSLIDVIRSPEGLGGGEDGIRTHEKLLTSTPLAGERLRPLGHLSVAPLDKEKRRHNQQALAIISEKEIIMSKNKRVPRRGFPQLRRFCGKSLAHDSPPRLDSVSRSPDLPVNRGLGRS